jgi:hypothetical protein
MPENKMVSMVFYPVVYDLDTDGDKFVLKNKDQVQSSNDYVFVTVKQDLNHGTGTYDGLRIS